MNSKYLDLAKKHQSDIIRASLSFAVILTLIFIAIFYRPNDTVPSVDYSANITNRNEVINKGNENPTYKFSDDKGTTYTYDFTNLKVYYFFDPIIGPMYRLTVDSLYVHDSLNKINNYYRVEMNFWAGVYFNGVYRLSDTNSFVGKEDKYINEPTYISVEQGVTYTFYLDGTYEANSKS